MPDVVRIARAIATNQIARFAPKVYLQLTGQTGRGNANSESVADIARYFEFSVAEYLARLAPQEVNAENYFAEKTVVEYGPGDFPGVAILIAAMGARKVYCVDRFPMVNLGEKNLEVLRLLTETLPPSSRQRLRDLFVNPRDPRSGLRSDKIEYLVKPHGHCGLVAEADVILSRAVLEHVDDLEGTFKDMEQAMKPGAVALHQVDLKSHGLHQRNPLDFLEWSPIVWSMMYSHKGSPNRWRVDRYRDIVADLGVCNVKFEPTMRADDNDVSAVRPRLAHPFRDLDVEDLRWLGMWLRFEKRAE